MILNIHKRQDFGPMSFGCGRGLLVQQCKINPFHRLLCCVSTFIKGIVHPKMHILFILSITASGFLCQCCLICLWQRILCTIWMLLTRSCSNFIHFALNSNASLDLCSNSAVRSIFPSKRSGKFACVVLRSIMDPNW